MKIERELLRGTGPIAVMKLLQGGEKYGYELVEELSRQSEGLLAMGQSTLYPMLYNLEAKGWIKSRRDEEGARPRKYYRLTKKGEKQLQADLQRWEVLVKAMKNIGVASGSAILRVGV
jgi:PadR family transcriptional regulator PadR